MKFNFKIQFQFQKTISKNNFNLKKKILKEIELTKKLLTSNS